jgi:predicted DNA-binding protein
MTTLIIPDDIGDRLAEFAEKAHLSKDQYAAQLLEEALEDQEDYLEALEISLRIERGEEKTIPFEEILKKYGIEDEPH